MESGGQGYRGGEGGGLAVSRPTLCLFSHLTVFKWADACMIDCLGPWVNMKKYASDTFNKFCFNYLILIKINMKLTHRPNL